MHVLQRLNFVLMSSCLFLLRNEYKVDDLFLLVVAVWLFPFFLVKCISCDMLEFICSLLSLV